MTLSESGVSETYTGTVQVGVSAVADSVNVSASQTSQFVATPEYIRLSDDAQYGTVQIYQSGTWSNMQSGVNYQVSNDLQTRLIVDSNVGGTTTTTFGTTGGSAVSQIGVVTTLTILSPLLARRMA